MARPLRIAYPGAVYHVMARGNQGRAVFGDDLDRRVFLEHQSVERFARLQGNLHARALDDVVGAHVLTIGSALTILQCSGSR